jgi:predicted RNA methylase
MTAHVAQNTGNNEWYSPPEIVEAARRVLGGFDLDPASSEIANQRVRADLIFTAFDNGLLQRWPVGRIWMNPPYGQPLIGQFCARFAEEVRRGSTGIALVNNATETQWFQAIAAVAGAMCFPSSRISFVTPDGIRKHQPLQGQVIIYAGRYVEQFYDEFSDFGLVVMCQPDLALRACLL